MTDPAAGCSAAERVRAMHHGPHPLVLPNVWDPASAREYAGAGFGALATSSAAVALTLGYTDGHTPGAEMLAAAARIAAAVDVPVTADIEDGYGLPPAELAGRLLDAGLVGCNLEDSDPAGRALRDPAAQADYLAAVRQAAGPALVINAQGRRVRPAAARWRRRGRRGRAAGPDLPGRGRGLRVSDHRPARQHRPPGRRDRRPGERDVPGPAAPRSPTWPRRASRGSPSAADCTPG